MSEKSYPQLDDLFAQRLRARKARARLSVAQKLKILEELKAKAEPFRLARQRRKQREPQA